MGGLLLENMAITRLLTPAVRFWSTEMDTAACVPSSPCASVSQRSCICLSVTVTAAFDFLLYWTREF